MGRSGGGGRSGGHSGGHSGGSFGGGHSSGRFSGGGRSSGGNFRGSPGGHGNGGPNYGPGNAPGGGPRPHNNFFFFRGPGRNSGPIYSYVIYMIIIIAILIFISAVFSDINSMHTSTSEISESTKDREALSGVVTKTDWYQDDIGWITNKSKLISGLEDFYDETGVQPYVLFVGYSSTYWSDSYTFNETEALDYLEEVYSNTFEDEGHFIFAYFQCEDDSKAEMEGEFLYLSGYSVDAIMDDEALSIFWGYFDQNYYNTSLSIEEMISNTFSQTADSIMSKATNGWDVLKVILIVIGIIVVVYIIYKIYKNKAKREKEKEEYTKEILSKPLETFGEDTSELEKKYKE